MKLQRACFCSPVRIPGRAEAPPALAALGGASTVTAADGVTLELAVDPAAGPVVWIRTTEGSMCIPLSNVASFEPVEQSAKDNRAARQQASA